MSELRAALKAGAIGVVGVVACTASVACGSDSPDTGGKAGKKSLGARENGPAGPDHSPSTGYGSTPVLATCSYHRTLDFGVRSCVP